MIPTLRDYQQKAYDDTMSSWANGDDVVFVCAPTGAGKSVLFTSIAQTLYQRGHTILFLCNRKELIEQAYQHFLRSRITPGVIMDGYELRYEMRCQVASIQTIINRKILPHFDYIICDESHFITTDNSFGRILNRFNTSKILMVSATPIRLDGKGFRNIVHGKETKLILTRSTRELINDGWLVPFKYLIPSVPDLDGVSMTAGDYDAIQAEEAMALAPLVESYLENTNGLQGIGFAVNVHHSKEIVKKYHDAGIYAAHLDANTPKYDRDRIIKDFKKGIIRIVYNVGIISYGFDFPDLRFVQLARPTKSLALFNQMCGRVTRTLAGLVNNNMTPLERCRAIAGSDKPHGIILDNAGAYMDNGLPDADVDWQYHFNGRKKKKNGTDEFIEMAVYEIEDPVTGKRKKVNRPEECKGMILVEVTRELQDNYNAVRHLKEFDRLYSNAIASAHVKQPGYRAFYQFQDYLRDRNIVCTDAMWRYFKKRLIDDITAHIDAFIAEKRADGVVILPFANEHCQRLRGYGVNNAFLMNEKKKYQEMISGSL